MKKIRNCFFWLICIIVISGCSSKIDKQIELVFEKTHEEDIRQALSDFNNYNGDFFERYDNNLIAYSHEYSKYIENITNLHKEFHLSDKIPRDSNDWSTLLYYIKNPPKLKKWHLRTQCPYCVAEENGDLKIDEMLWYKTSLFSDNIPKHRDALLKFMKNDEMKMILTEFEEYLKTEKCFSDKEKNNWLFCSTINGNKYYVNGTVKYNDYISKIRIFHDKYHCYSYFGRIADTLFSWNKNADIDYGVLYDSEFHIKRFNDVIKYDRISCCPICQLIYRKKALDIFQKKVIVLIGMIQIYIFGVKIALEMCYSNNIILEKKMRKRILQYHYIQ